MRPIFGYGSLLYDRPPGFEPGIPAWLDGYRRTLNKRSDGRGCPQHSAALPQGLDGWQSPTLRYGLAMGLVPDATRTFAQAFPLSQHPSATPDDLLRAIDRREGWVPGSPPGACAYVREPCTLHTDRGPLPAWVYATPAACSMIYDLDDATIARILAHATPRVPNPHAQGIDYALRAAQALHHLGHPDPWLDAIVDRALHLLPPDARDRTPKHP